MSVVDQALLKLFANEQRQSAAGATQQASEAGTATSTADPSVAVPAEAACGNEPFTSDANDRLMALRFDIPSTITSLDVRPTDQPKATEAPAAGYQADRTPNADVPETDLQIAGLKAAGETRTAPTNASPPEVVDQSATTPDFVATTFRFDSAHERRVPAAHLLPLAGREATQERPAKAEHAAQNSPADTPAVTESAEAASSDEPGGPSDEATRDFKAAFEVDQFLWPTICESLYAAVSSDIKAAATRVLNEARGGQNVVAVTGLEGATGCTTFALCLAQQLAALDASVLVVDANFGNPSLASSLGITSQFGWNQDSPQRQDVAETLIESLQDRIAIAPLNKTDPPASLENSRRNWCQFVAVVRDHFDAVLVDAEPLERSLNTSQFSVFQPGTVDQVILLQPDSGQAARQLAGPVRGLLAAGVTPLGIVCNAHAAGATAEH